MWWFLLSLETIGICLVVWWLLRTYAAKGTSRVILYMTGFGWACCFFIVVLVPSDIATYIHHHTANSQGGTFVVPDEAILINMWRIVYWVTFFGCWIILPVTQAYHEAGEFTRGGRLKAALIENIVFYSVAAVLGILFVAYIATVHHLTGDALTQFLMALANAWGLTLLVICLGYGLVEIPKKLLRQTNEATNLRFLQFKAISVYENLKEAQLDLKEAARQLHRANEALQDHELMPFMEIILAKMPEEFLAAAAESETHRNRSRDDEPDLSYKGLVKLHTKVRSCTVAFRRCTAEWDELCLDAWETEDVIEAQQLQQWTPIVPVGSSHRTGILGNMIERTKWAWKVKLRVPCTYAMFGAAALLSAGILWLELTIPIPSETARLSWLYYMVHSTSGLGVQVVAGIPFIYMSLCTYYSLFCLKVFNFYALHPNQQTEGPSLLFNAALLCRLVAPLSFNFLQCIDENLESSYQAYMGEMDTVPVLGESFNLYVPVFISIFVVFTTFNCYTHVAKCCPGVNQFSFTDNTQNQDNIEDGQNMLRRERTSRERKHASSLEARQLEARKSTSERSPYDKVSRHSDLDGDRDELEVDVEMEQAPSLFEQHASKLPAKGSRAAQALQSYYKERELEPPPSAVMSKHSRKKSDDFEFERGSRGHSRNSSEDMGAESRQEFESSLRHARQPSEDLRQARQPSEDLPTMIPEPAPAPEPAPRHQFGGKPAHQFGGGSRYEFGGGVS